MTTPISRAVSVVRTVDDITGISPMSIFFSRCMEPIHMTWVFVGFGRSRLLPIHSPTSVRQREKRPTATDASSLTRSAGWPAQFNTASAFSQLHQYTSSPCRRGYCYAELVVFFPSSGRNHRQYSLCLPTEGWPGWVGLDGWLRSEIVYLPEGSHPSQY